MAQKISARTPLINDTGNQGSSSSLSAIVSKILQALKRLCCCCCSVDDVDPVDPVVHHVSSDAMLTGQTYQSSVVGQAAYLPRMREIRVQRSVPKQPSFYPMDIKNYRRYREEIMSSCGNPPEEMLSGIHDALKSLSEEEMIGKNFELYHFKRDFSSNEIIEVSPEEMHSAIIYQVNADLPRQHVVINGRVFRGNGKNADEVEQVFRPASGSLQKINLILTLIQQGVYGGFTNKLFSFPMGDEEGFAVREAGEIPPALRRMKVFINTEREPIEIRMEKLFKFVNEDGETLAFVNIEISFQIPKDENPIRCQWKITPIECKSQFAAWDDEFPELR